MRIRSQTSMPLWVYRSIATSPQRLPLICCRCLPALAFLRGRLTIAVFRGRFLCCRHPGHPLVRCDRLSCEDNIIDRERRRLLDFSQTFPVRHYILKLNDRLRVLVPSDNFVELPANPLLQQDEVLFESFHSQVRLVNFVRELRRRRRRITFHFSRCGVRRSGFHGHFRARLLARRRGGRCFSPWTRREVFRRHSRTSEAAHVRVVCVFSPFLRRSCGVSVESLLVGQVRRPGPSGPVRRRAVGHSSSSLSLEVVD